MNKYQVVVSRLFKEIGVLTVEAEDSDHAREVAEMCLNDDDGEWSQEGIEDERIESITEIDP